LSPSWYC